LRARHCKDFLKHASSLRVGSTDVPERIQPTRQPHREICLAIVDRPTESGVQILVLPFGVRAHGYCPRPFEFSESAKRFGHSHEVDSLTTSDFGSFATRLQLRLGKLTDRLEEAVTCATTGFVHLLSPNTRRRPLADTSKAATEGQVER
jgi:hypothetical protein